jgi:hypothetical protein
MRNDTTAYYFADDLPDAGIQFRCLTGEGRREKGEGRREKGEGRREKGGIGKSTARDEAVVDRHDRITRRASDADHCTQRGLQFRVE